MAQSIKTTNQKIRVGGSGYTVFQWQGQVIGWAKSVGHTSPQPVAPPSSIHPLDSRYPLQIITPGAIGAGTLQVRYFEKYNEKVWDDIMKTVSGGDTIYNDLAQVFIQLAALNNAVTCFKIINPPTLKGAASGIYADVYHNCVITDIRDDENIEVESMEIIKAMTIQYTYATRYGKGYGSMNTPNGLAVDTTGLPSTAVTDTNFI
jgi:hypothetical protein